MAPRNKSRPPNQVEDDVTEERSIQEEITAAEVDTEEAWAAMEGYTPLTDTRTNGAVFMAFNPGNEEGHDGTTFTGAFFADMSAFGPSMETPADEWDEQESDDEDVVIEASEQTDFRSAADQALQALEEEYSMALSSVVVPSSTAQESAASGSEKTLGATAMAPGLSLPRQVTLANEPTNSPKTETPKKEPPPIDTDAVRKAVDAIRLKAPRLTSDLNKWEEQHGVTNTSTMALAPRDHSIIPKTPLTAFWRQSPKAISAAANLSRSATLAEAIVRLECLQSGKELLVIDIVGADHVECSTDEQLRTTFGPLVRWIGALENSPQHIAIRLIGPNVPTEAAKRPPLDLMPANKASSRLKSATATCHECVYHEWIQSQEKESKDFCSPDVAIAFNSGIWGYIEWLPTLEALCQSSWSVLFVSTAYTIEECEDDAEVIENAVSSSMHPAVIRHCLWKTEANPFASRKVRETVTAASGRDYRENTAWQAWKLGGSND